MLALALALSAAQILLWLPTRSFPLKYYGFRGFEVLFAAVFAMGGFLLATRRPENPIGWLFLSGALIGAFQGFGSEYGTYSFVKQDRSLPLTDLLAWLQNWIWVPLIACLAIYPLLLFPNGRLLSRRWRVVGWAVPLGVLLFGAGIALDPGQLQSLPDGFLNPFAASQAIATALVSLGTLPFMGATVMAVVSVVLRFRRSIGEEREQLKWLAFAGVLLAAALVLNVVVSNSRAAGLAMLASLAGIGAATAVAVLKYRLYDIDVVISRTVVFGILAVFLTLVYVGIVVGVGSLVTGSETTPGNLLTFAAAALVAVAFQPVRSWARRIANRIVYGERATPYEVLSEFAGRMAGSYDPDDILPRMARMLTDGTGATSARVWLRVGREIRPAAWWPAQPDHEEPVPLSGDGPLQLPGSSRTYPVRHQGELLGALTVTKPPADPITPGEDQLLADLASQAGLLLRNARLIEELRASRQRLVAAQDAERRRLERNIHDGAQQHLVALGVKLGLMKVQASRDPRAATPLIEQLQGEVQEALESLRDLARGIYPPLLADHGLPDAMRAQLRKIPLPVELSTEGVGRYPQEVEAAVYFCCLEALQNVAKYAGPATARVRLEATDGSLTFSVQDDGVGFDPESTARGMGLQNMADRVSALGGELEVTSRPGEGTTVVGRLPVPPAAAPADGATQPVLAAAQASVSRSGPNAAFGM